MSFSDYVRLLRSYWRSVAALMVVGAIAGVAISYTTTPTYAASARVLFSPNPAAGVSGQDLAFASTYVQARMRSYQDLATSPQVLAPTISFLELDESATDLATATTATYPATSSVMTIRVVDRRPSRALAVATSLARSLITQVQTIETSPAAITAYQQQKEAAEAANANAGKNGEKTPLPPVPQPQVTGLLVDQPTTTTQVSPDRRVLGVAGAAFGLLAGLGQALVRHRRPAREEEQPEPTADDETDDNSGDDSGDDAGDDADEPQGLDLFEDAES